MVICKMCWTPMVGVISFSKDNREKYCRCPKCRGETKHQKIKEDNLIFKEVLDKAIGKRR